MYMYLCPKNVQMAYNLMLGEVIWVNSICKAFTNVYVHVHVCLTTCPYIICCYVVRQSVWLSTIHVFT